MEQQKLKWNNLRKNKCPKCNSFLSLFANDSGYFSCANQNCTFIVSEEKLSRLTMSMTKQGLERSEYQNGEEVEDLKKGFFD